MYKITQVITPEEQAMIVDLVQSNRSAVVSLINTLEKWCDVIVIKKNIFGLI